MADLPLFIYTTQERIYGELVFIDANTGAGLDISDRKFQMPITQALTTRSGAVQPPVKTLAIGSGLAIKSGTTNTLVFQVSKAEAQGWDRGEYTADILDGEADNQIMFMPVRLRYVDPSAVLNYLSRSQRAVYAANRQTIITTSTPAVGPQGVQGVPGSMFLILDRDPVPADIPLGTFALVTNTVTKKRAFYVNEGGVLYDPVNAGKF